MKNDFNYKWSKLFASKRYNTKDGVIKLTPEEQQELLDDSERLVKKCSIPDDVGQSEQYFCEHEEVGYNKRCKEQCSDCNWIENR